MAGEFGQRIGGAQVKILPRCGHLPHEERPDEFNQLALAFLAHRLKNLGWPKSGRNQEKEA